MRRFYIALLLVLAGCTPEPYSPQATEFGDALVTELDTYENFHFIESTREQFRDYEEMHNFHKDNIVPWWYVMFEIQLDDGQAATPNTINYRIMISLADNNENVLAAIQSVDHDPINSSIIEYNSTLFTVTLRETTGAVTQEELDMYHEMVKQMIMNITV